MKSTISALSKREFTILRCKYSKNERDKQSRTLIFRSECRLYSPFTANIVKTSESSYKRVNKSSLLFSTSAIELGQSQISNTKLALFHEATNVRQSK